MSRTLYPPPAKVTTLDTVASVDVKELDRLHKVESAALAVLATMPRRDGKPFSFTGGTMPAILKLDESLQQDEEDGDGGDNSE